MDTATQRPIHSHSPLLYSSSYVHPTSHTETNNRETADKRNEGAPTHERENIETYRQVVSIALLTTTTTLSLSISLPFPSHFSGFLYAPYATWPIGLSSSMPGAMKFVRGSPVSLAAEQRAIVGE